MNLSEEEITASVERLCADYGALVQPPPECINESGSLGGSSFRFPVSLVNLSLTDWCIIASFIFISVMLTSLCCIFFWWRRKSYMEKKAKKVMEELNNQKRQRSVSVIHHTTPAICSDNIISFVLPTVSSIHSLLECELKLIRFLSTMRSEMWRHLARWALHPTVVTCSTFFHHHQVHVEVQVYHV